MKSRALSNILHAIIGCCVVASAMVDARYQSQPQQQQQQQQQQSERVLLKSIRTMTLYDGRFTSGRRLEPVQQLMCVGGTAGCLSRKPQVVVCQNISPTDIFWECKSDLDKNYQLASVDVNCEGYDYAGDNYVLTGSCSLRYKLDFTSQAMPTDKGGDGVIVVVTVVVATVVFVAFIVHVTGRCEPTD